MICTNDTKLKLIWNRKTRPAQWNYKIIVYLLNSYVYPTQSHIGSKTLENRDYVFRTVIFNGSLSAFQPVWTIQHSTLPPPFIALGSNWENQISHPLWAAFATTSPTLPHPQPPRRPCNKGVFYYFLSAERQTINSVFGDRGSTVPTRLSNNLHT